MSFSNPGIGLRHQHRIVLAFIVSVIVGICFSSCAELGQFAQSPEGQRLMRTVETEAVRALDSQLYAQPVERDQ